ncbi:MAG: alpha-glucan family phosphorylase [Planctomycetota bacterium]
MTTARTDAGTLGFQPRVAYFTMEIGLSDALPTYSGGLGVLAGDTLRSAADLRVPMVAVTLLHRGGYFTQTLDADGTQHDAPIQWNPGDLLTELAPRTSITLGGDEVHVRAWMCRVRGRDGFEAPVLFLDTDLPENDAAHRGITNRLYGGGDELRLQQEAVLGIGGVRMLAAMGCDRLARYHMNEGHASLLVPELARRLAAEMDAEPTDDRVREAVRDLCVFTTHTPVPAGHDRFPMPLAETMLEPAIAALLAPEPEGGTPTAPVEATPAARRGAAAMSTSAVADAARAGTLNMTLTGFELSGHINAVARRHGAVSRRMFGRADIKAITNGVHAGTWACPAMARVFDEHLPAWRDDNSELRAAVGIPADALLAAHAEAKRALVDRVNGETKAGFDADAFTIGFGRRATAYKRLTLLLSDVERLESIAGTHGTIQVVLAGKAHPKDEPGRELIAEVHRIARALAGPVRVVYLPGYDMELCGRMVAGSDIWLNTPRPPLEASGTSGMKAALNGVPNLSTLDGWWLEGCVEGVTGWAIGGDDFADPDATPPTPKRQDERHAADLYSALDEAVLPAFAEPAARWAPIMAHSIALNGAHFTTQRMVREYAGGLYF